MASVSQAVGYVLVARPLNTLSRSFEALDNVHLNPVDPVGFDQSIFLPRRYVMYQSAVFAVGGLEVGVGHSSSRDIRNAHVCILTRDCSPVAAAGKDFDITSTLVADV